MAEDPVAKETTVAMEQTATVSVEHSSERPSPSSRFSAWFQWNLVMFRKYWRTINMWYAVFSIPVAVFDTASDWWVFCEYVQYGEGILGASVGVICFVGTILFCVDLYVSVITIRFYSRKSASAATLPTETGDQAVGEKVVSVEERKASEGESEEEEEEDDAAKDERKMLNAASEKPEDPDTQNVEASSEVDQTKVTHVVHEVDNGSKWDLPDEKSEESRVFRWQEVISFLILVLEDFPTALIIYLAFEKGNCEVFTRIYKDTFAAQLALISGFVSVVWKGFVSLRYAFRCRFHGLQGYTSQCFCCILRTLRPFLVLCLCFFIAYIYLEIRQMKQLHLNSDDICENLDYIREQY